MQTGKDSARIRQAIAVEELIKRGFEERPPEQNTYNALLSVFSTCAPPSLDCSAPPLQLCRCHPAVRRCHPAGHVPVCSVCNVCATFGLVGVGDTSKIMVALWFDTLTMGTLHQMQFHRCATEPVCNTERNCRGMDASTSFDMVVNLLKAMDGRSKKLTYESALITLRVMADARSYKALMEIVREMQQQRLPLPCTLLDDVRCSAAEVCSPAPCLSSHARLRTTRCMPGAAHCTVCAGAGCSTLPSLPASHSTPMLASSSALCVRSEGRVQAGHMDAAEALRETLERAGAALGRRAHPMRVSSEPSSSEPAKRLTPPPAPARRPNPVRRPDSRGRMVEM